MHVITGLGVGGAEVMLHRLLEASNREADAHEVVSLTELGEIGGRLLALGVPTVALGMRRSGVRLPDPVRVLRLARLMRAFRPDVVQTWLAHADLLGGIAARVARVPRVVWGIHNSTIDPIRTRRTTQWTVAACARLSRSIPDVIVSVSRAARDVHVAAGYDPSKFVLIPNGFDLAQYRPDPEARAGARAELGLPPEAVVIGLPARFDPQKDHANFVRAAARLAARRPCARFVLCGLDTGAENAELAGLLAAHRLRDRFHLLGRRDDMPRVLNALDIASLSSAFGEAFPLAIGEAMACGVPAVVTDLGDCAHLLGDTGRVVPPRDPAALADAWEALVALGPEGRRALGLAARERVATHFALPRIAEQYAALYRRAAAGAGAPSW
jgi:glycosyltransferase involved in cell wall biosynthesis